jgi:hypothetical protein
VWESWEQLSNRVLAAFTSTRTHAWQPVSELASWRHEAQPLPPPCSDGACSRAFVELLPSADPQVAIDRHGGVAAVWDRAYAYRSVTVAASRPAGRKWSAARRISTAGALPPRVAIDGAGQAFALWIHEPCRTLCSLPETLELATWPT